MSISAVFKVNALVSSHGYVWVSQDKRPPVVQMWEAGTREAVSITIHGGAMEQLHILNRILAIFDNFIENFHQFYYFVKSRHATMANSDILPSENAS